MQTPEEVALQNCESEPVHTPGRIQSCGSILGFDRHSFCLTHRTENLGSHLSQSTKLEFGRSIDEQLENRSLAHAIRNSLGFSTISTQRERLGTFLFNERQFDAGLFVSDDTAVLELEELKGPPDSTFGSISRVRSMLAGLVLDGTIEDALKSATVALRGLTGFDRVMGYRFLPGGDGEVAAETRTPSVDAFLGLRYPAYDIPPQVRRLALKMPFRMITDVGDPHIDIHSPSAEPLDMTLSHFRGVSPIHIEYLTNMGVGATLNLSIIVRGELWGLFAFHHYEPKTLSPEHRAICELFGQLFSLQLQQKLEADLSTRKERAHLTRDAIRDCGSVGLAAIFAQLSDAIGENVNADGVALVQRDSIEITGDVPEQHTIRAIVDIAKDQTLAVDQLDSLPEISEAGLKASAGALVTAVDANATTHIVYFRNEIIRKIRWGGVPTKHIEHGASGPRLHPRGSFEAYSQVVAGKCEPWTQGDLSSATELANIVLDMVFQDSAALISATQKEKRYNELLTSELNHRVKNILALVRSISNQTKESAVSLESYVEAFEKRIAALSTVHGLTGGSGLQWARLREILSTEVKPYLDNQQSINITGDPLGLRSDVAPIMALVFHELASNSAKFGALAYPSATLDIQWHSENGGVAIEWVEKKVPSVPRSNRRGFGLTLIETAVPYECGGEADVKFEADGINVRFWLPHSATTSLNEAPKPVREPAPVTTIRKDASEFALVLEDNMVLAIEMEKMLREFGVGTVVAVPNEKLARTELKRNKVSFAILDINLGTATSFEFAKSLHERGIPFAFVSGYDSCRDIPDPLGRYPRLVKPVDHSYLKEVVNRLRD